MKIYPILIIVTFLLHLLWESLQVSLYGGYEALSPYMHITLFGTIGDVLYTLSAVLFIALISRKLKWIYKASWCDYIALLIMGFFIAIFVEYKAFVFDRWFYLDPMPIVPILEIGLSPFLQMIILLPLSVFITKYIANYLKSNKNDL